MDSGRRAAKGEEQAGEDPTTMPVADNGSEYQDLYHPAKPTRLSVNISRDSAEALQEISSDKGITMTEAVRRLVGYGIIMYRANRDGYEVLLRRDNKLEKILLVD